MITYTLPLRWKNGVRGSYLIRMVTTDFLNTQCDEYGVGYVLRKYPDLENTLGMIKLVGFSKCGWWEWWHRIQRLCIVNEASETWHAKELWQQHDISGLRPLALCFPPLHGESATWFSHRPGVSNGEFLPGTRGQRRYLGSHLPVQSFSFGFNPVSSLSIASPKYSNPYWSFPTLNFSHATFCRRRERRMHLFIFALLLIYAM